MTSLLFLISKGRGQDGDGDWEAGEIIAVRNPIPHHGKETPLFGRIYVPDVPKSVIVGNICQPHYTAKSGHEVNEDYYELHSVDSENYPLTQLARRRFYLDSAQYSTLNSSYFLANETATAPWPSLILIDRRTDKRAADGDFA